jgi:hypothetical protein
VPKYSVKSVSRNVFGHFGALVQRSNIILCLFFDFAKPATELLTPKQLNLNREMSLDLKIIMILLLYFLLLASVSGQNYAKHGTQFYFSF